MAVCVDVAKVSFSSAIEIIVIALDLRDDGYFWLSRTHPSTTKIESKAPHSVKK
jgi:hypothetical protein